MLGLLYFTLSLIPAGLAATEYLLEKNHQAQSTNHRLHYSSPLQQQQNKHHNPQPITYEKEYFFFSAPEEDPRETAALEKLTNSVKKRQQVVFIKTPMNAAYEKALENILRNSAEKQTHIYVFSQKPNYDALLQKLHSSAKNVLPKPEVHFVKYANPAHIQSIRSLVVEQSGSASDNKPVYSLPPANENTPVSKNYAMSFLPAGIDVVPGSSYIPLFLL